MKSRQRIRCPKEGESALAPMSDDPNHVGDVFAYQSIDRATMRLIEEWRNLMVTDRDAVIDRLGFTHMPADVTAAARIAIELLEKLGYE